MIAFSHLEGHGSSPAILTVIHDQKISSLALCNLLTREWSKQILLPSANASCFAVNARGTKIAIGGWDSGKIQLFQSSGEVLAMDRIKNLSSLKFTDSDSLTCTTENTVFEWVPDSSMKKSFRSKGSIIENLGNFIINQVGSRYEITEAHSGDLSVSIRPKETGITSTFILGSMMVISQTKGDVLLINLKSGEIEAEINSPKGHNPIHCGFVSETREIAVFHADLNTRSDGILSCYDGNGRLTWDARVPICPSVAVFSPIINGFITGSRKALFLQRSSESILVEHYL